jgi:hypothetical protein
MRFIDVFDILTDRDLSMGRSTLELMLYQYWKESEHGGIKLLGGTGITDRFILQGLVSALDLIGLVDMKDEGNRWLARLPAFSYAIRVAKEGKHASTTKPDNEESRRERRRYESESEKSDGDYRAEVETASAGAGDQPTPPIGTIEQTTIVAARGAVFLQLKIVMRIRHPTVIVDGRTLMRLSRHVKGK